MNILVFGGVGQLGQCIQKVAEQKNISGLIYLDEKEGNILDLDLLKALFQKYKPSYVINCAAYTAVDKAEDEVEIARKVNKDGAANLAILSAEFDATLIHISTDFVFEGNQTGLLTEEMSPTLLVFMV
jgi:dTDP-4-dehydrorhamnose reductase